MALLLLLWPAWLGAVEVVDGPRVNIEGTTATVSWKLDSPAGGTVRFGPGKDSLEHIEKSPAVAREHSVRLKGLKPGEQYHFSIGTARRVLREGTFIVAGVPPSPPAANPTPSPNAPSASTRDPASPRATKSTAESTAPPARQTWANVATLRDHFERHGQDFAASSPEDYAAQAWRFLQRAKNEGLPAKLDPEGTLRIWDPRTRAFAAFNRQGMTKTYFKPNSRDYFERQPGLLVRLKPDPATDQR
ncbi:MAG: hypothetical protein ACKV19_27615 [Verrucomicrobiales bacterium]